MHKNKHNGMQNEAICIYGNTEPQTTWWDD